MKTDFSFSYLFLSRHGIYYFRCRIPKPIRLKYNLRQTEIRRSLHTSNRREAIKRAMRQWVEYSDKYFLPIQEINMAGIPTNKYDLITGMPRAIQGIRDEIGIHGDDIKSTWLTNYLKNIGDDPDVLRAFMDLITDEEKKNISSSFAYKRAITILSLTTTQTPHNPIHHQSVQQELPSIKSKPISELIDLYMQRFVKDYRLNRKREIPKRSYNESVRSLSVFAAIVGNKLSDNLTKTDIKRYDEISLELPSRLNKIDGFTHLTNEDILSRHLNEFGDVL